MSPLVRGQVELGLLVLKQRTGGSHVADLAGLALCQTCGVLGVQLRIEEDIVLSEV